MNQFVTTLNSGIKYSKTLIAKRNNESLIQTIEMSEDSALKLLDHSLSTIIHFSRIDYENFETDNVKPLVFENKSSIKDQIIKYLDISTEEFSNCMNRLSDERKGELNNFIGTTVMHTLTHVGQAMRLQKLYLEKENFLSIKNISN